MTEQKVTNSDDMVERVALAICAAVADDGARRERD